MNIQLSNAEEIVDGKNAGSLGQVLIRYVLILLQGEGASLVHVSIVRQGLRCLSIGATMYSGYRVRKERTLKIRRCRSKVVDLRSRSASLTICLETSIPQKSGPE